jgi:hypothetical protein
MVAGQAPRGRAKAYDIIVDASQIPGRDFRNLALNCRPTIPAHQSVIGGKPDLSKTPQNRHE